MLKIIALAAVAAAGLVVGFGAPDAWAGLPAPWQEGLQTAVTPVAHKIHDFHNMLLVIITTITAFVTAMLLIIIVRFNRKANPEPSKTAHNTLLEVVWTALPVIILVVIAIPSFRLLYYMDRAVEPEMTIKAIGHQWYWSYEYPDAGFEFDATLVEEEDLQPGQPRLLQTDNVVVVPVDTTVQLLVTAPPEDVIHSWAMPAFGVKTDAVPGRLNETWFRVEKEGTYYGQCSELCGINHGFMPITVKAVSREEYARWLASARAEFAAIDAPTVKIAQVQSGRR